MKKEFIIEQITETRSLYTFTEPNAKGEKIVAELVKCSNSNPATWKKRGFIDKALETYWSIEVYVTDTEGNCWGRYNPQHKLSEDGKRMVINFDWIFEATEENKKMLIDEVYRIASSAQGKTATEEKYDKIKAFAEQHNVDLLTKLPEGWKIIGGMTAPIGSTWISNNGSFRDRSRKTALLLV